MTAATCGATLATMSPFHSFDLDDLKLVYRVLHTQLLSELALLDCEFFSALQTWLQALAREEGVDVGDHSRWDAWLSRSAGTLKIVP